MRGKSKFFAAFLAVVLFMGMAIASTSDDDNPAKESGGTASTSKKAEEKFGISETAVFKELKITANEVKSSQGSEFNKPADGKVFIGVKFTIENISEKEQALSTLLLFDAYADDVKCDFSVGASMAFNEGTLDGSLAPGKKMVGYYAVEVPTATQKLDLEVKASLLSSSKAKFEIAVPK